MEGIIALAPFWLIYAVFAAVGYWCWQGLFFWLERDSDLRRFFHMLGAVLLFTPAPISAGSSYFAPAFLVFPFTALSSSVQDAMYSLSWFLGGLCIGLMVLALRQFIRWSANRQGKPAEE
ncbi:MAG: hypothetical protein CMI08_07730 [Oceanospirillaceae bacterium]|uniref:hypothetical protein n=1 Tax=unclassified Thalassolituus TaxID=2624967 RepID=UPI000C3D1875|nr:MULTISPECIES: hypothetical protein [unclassified Thalassolituus]MAS24988.1 hypothetical protein [Oceanospirillaceae bacterium]MAX99082.1 hypothetical protein [Oceanospirillaceae bacterium]MBL35030.1 hypothetical protein [Oceanospirillaceae bacterium]MBS53201.1 hypothetical protein [Oceanospirillaceae bacterium]|tara:strand:- start:314 stop:673 length:360 start_codon:yes stop_codon:yes gene_type:complete